ncbi:RtcB family protein [Noviherbaspirillum sedimenti]|uniref:tRNA-splicing ligase RtcB n=1 Tax=Noviherbaspirillum sedimenti TaxID=2320865 RepID=A0A3A3G3I1_9BURK|nr:RtcB family protein [Noviherbaspirillum sedimenti]RJG01042.1 RtcB family protein [Noviherbaspirillum sedimenti]
MDTARFIRQSANVWEIAPHGAMRVPAIIFASEALLRDMDDKVVEQISNVAMLPGIVKAAYAMPDAHWGYGFPIGGVAAFDPEEGGVVSAGGVGFDISCGVRLLRTGLREADLHGRQRALAAALFHDIPAGVGSHGALRLTPSEMDHMLTDGARWAVARGYGTPMDLLHTEEYGRMADADPHQVSEAAKQRQRDEMGTLGSGNHYLEVQKVSQILDANIAAAYGLHEDDIVISIHCGSRGLGHQIGTEFLREMVVAAPQHKIALPDRELACAPIDSALGQRYLGAMRAAINCALANRQILTDTTRTVFAKLLPAARLSVLYDVSHNTCKVEQHEIDGRKRKLYVHRKGATRAFGPDHPAIPEDLRPYGQPVLIGGSMGTASYVLAGTPQSMGLAFGSACHGAGRSMSRTQALKQFGGRHIVDELEQRGILIRSPSLRGVAEEAPDAYKDVTAVVAAADQAGLAHIVARLEPKICIKG